MNGIEIGCVTPVAVGVIWNEDSPMLTAFSSPILEAICILPSTVIVLVAVLVTEVFIPFASSMKVIK